MNEGRPWGGAGGSLAKNKMESRAYEKRFFDGKLPHKVRPFKVMAHQGQESQINKFLISIACLLTAISILPTAATAQSAEVSTYSRDYYRCSEALKNPIDTIFANIKMAIEIYNQQPNVDMKMQLPDPTVCYLEIWNETTRYAGTSIFIFYPSEEYFICAINDNCVGDLQGYEASMTLLGEVHEIAANAGGRDDSVYICGDGQGNTSLNRC